MPCPAAITVLLICLQLRKLSLGVSLVPAFSVGLALTLVVTGAVAAIGVRAATRCLGNIQKIARIAPLFSLCADPDDRLLFGVVRLADVVIQHHRKKYH